MGALRGAFWGPRGGFANPRGAGGEAAKARELVAALQALADQGDDDVALAAPMEGPPPPPPIKLKVVCPRRIPTAHTPAHSRFFSGTPAQGP